MCGIFSKEVLSKHVDVEYCYCSSCVWYVDGCICCINR
ncbi:DUF2627 domain-containing protein [Escherichia sp. R-CC3]